MRLTHHQVWTAIDALAARYGFSPSGLAKRAGLDPTTFNRSKRVTPKGRDRWPSTESLSKVLEATGADLDELMALVRNAGKDSYEPANPIPLIGFAQAGVIALERYRDLALLDAAWKYKLPEQAKGRQKTRGSAPKR